MSDWRNKIPHEQVESDPTKQNIITGQLHRLIKLGVLMPEASQLSDTGIYVTIGLPSPTGTSKLQVGGTVAANEAEYDYELATLGQVKALAVPTLPQLKTINNESIVGTGNIVISGGVDVTLGIQKNGLVLVGQELSLGLATNLVSGALSNTDWDTFNSKQNALGFTPEDIANKNQNNGYAGLDSSGKINPLQLPALAITDTFVVASQAEQLALVAEVGDVAVRIDISKSLILTQSPASTLANWQELLTPTDAVQSVNGQAGNVNLTTANIPDSAEKRYQTDSQKLFNDATSSIQTQLNNRSLLGHTHNLQSVINAGNTVVNGLMYFKNSSGIQDAYFRESGVFFNYTQSYGLAGLYQSSFASQGISFSFTSNTDNVYNTLYLSTDNLSGGGSKQVKIQNKSGTIALLSDIPSPTEVDQTIVDGSINAVSSNAVFDGLALKANLASPAFSGTPTVPTAPAGDNSTQIASTAFMVTAISTAALDYVKTTGNQVVGGSKKFLAATVFDGELLVKQAVAGAYNAIKAVDGGMNFYNNSGTSFNFKLRNSSFEFGLSATLARIDSSLLTRAIQYNLPDSPSSSVTFALTVNPTAISATQFNVSALNTAPASATSAGTTGEIRVTSTHIYVCIATNTWVRSALTNW